ncbi:hypothetical protein FIBSPDRAFT_721324 [Athelia psychrophila]|uniref:Casein kinase substrate phosphoprotein PP28 domain-containing protein n=1 Tax=Athelia psychrophila TaxID=1759441 RepID=A0A166W2E4_9AGAM|nr:hypothetical protein FIBSPDRAFT_721324 [Fibularhizoctonia sp. CBS 109695]
MEALTRAERHEMRTQQYQKGQSEPKKVSVDETLINSNYVKEKMGITGFGDFKDHKLSKREQCVHLLDKKDAKERYWKLHLAGKTHQAKFDLGRLAKIKVERQQAAAKRLAETEGMFSSACVWPSVLSLHSYHP